MGCLALTFRQTNIIWINWLMILKLFQLSTEPIWTRDTIVNFLKNSTGYVIIDLLFILFVVINRGIALGDRKNHQITINFPQFFYCCLFIMILIIPSISFAETAREFGRCCYEKPVVAGLSCLFHLLSIATFT